MGIIGDFQPMISPFQSVWQNLPLWCPIMGSHIHRIGLLRVFVGAVGMYLSVPVFILVHAVVIQIVFRWIIFPVLGLGSLSTEQYIILDRYKVEGLSWIDKLHCLFCGWVNGICTFLDCRVDLISSCPIPLTRFKKAILTLVCLVYTVPAVMVQLLFFLVYNYLIAAPLELEKVYYGPLIHCYCFKNPYAQKHRPWARRFLVYQKISWQALGAALKQIESAWCPIKHFERMEKGIYPNHHRLFFEPHQVGALRRFLRRHKTVLDRKLD